MRSHFLRALGKTVVVSSTFNMLIDPSKGGSASGTFVLPCNGSGYNATVDWGDSNTETITGSPGNVSHTYTGYVSGTYTVKITENAVGGFPTIYFNNAGDKLKLMQISQWGTNKWVGLTSSFYGCSNLTITATDGATANTGTVTSFSRAWRTCSAMTSFPLLDTSLVTNFFEAWLDCSALTSFPALNTVSGNDFRFAWRNCNKLTSFPTLSTSLGTSFERTWQDCSALTSFPALDIGSATALSLTWYNCQNLTSFPTLDTSDVTNFAGAWRNCFRLTSFPTLDTSKGTSFSETWRDCYALTSFPTLNTGAGTNFNTAWYNCNKLTSFPTLDTSKGTSFSEAWRLCNSLGGYAFPALDMHLMSNGTSCFTGWAMTNAAYNAILDQLANGNGGSIPATTINSVTFSGGNSHYDTGPPDGVAARGHLTTTHSWTITDGGTP